MYVVRKIKIRFSFFIYFSEIMVYTRACELSLHFEYPLFRKEKTQQIMIQPSPVQAGKPRGLQTLYWSIGPRRPFHPHLLHAPTSCGPPLKRRRPSPFAVLSGEEDSGCSGLRRTQRQDGVGLIIASFML